MLAPMPENATVIVNEGDELFAKREYKEALARYTQALVYESDNASLYVKRADCHHAMGNFIQMERDARTATRLNESLPKAWDRLAVAQESQDNMADAAESWRRAIAIMPADDTQEAVSNGRALYEAALEALEGPRIDLDIDTQIIAASAGSNTPALYGLSRASSTRSSRSSVLWDSALAFKEKNNKNSPWNKARAAMPRVLRQGLVKRCAITLADAYTEFQAGEKKMALLKSDGSQLGMQGEMGAVQCFSNAFLKDSRIIRLTTPEWTENFYLQASLEAAYCNTPNFDQDIEDIAAFVRHLKNEGGWDAVRPAIGTGVRSSIVLSLIKSGSDLTVVDSVILLDRALAVLQWGRKEWPNVPRQQRGAVFEDTFVRGVRTMRLERYLQALLQLGGSDKRFRYVHVSQEADAILRDVRRQDWRDFEKNPGFVLAFFIYPEAIALAAKGLYHMRCASVYFHHDAGSANVALHATQSYEFYLRGAELFPQDDERCVYFLILSIVALFRAGALLKKTLPMIPRIKQAMNNARDIWEQSPLYQSCKNQVKLLERFEKVVRDDMKKGRVSENDTLHPEWAAFDAVNEASEF